VLDQGCGAQRPDEQLLGEHVRGDVHLHPHPAGLRLGADHQELGKPVQPGVRHAGQHLMGDSPEPRSPGSALIDQVHRPRGLIPR
jgi:hypothetical protein